MYFCKLFSDVKTFTYLCFQFTKFNFYISISKMETEKDRIEKIMDEEGLNASQFASEIGIKSPTLSHILNGRNNPSLDVLKRILDRYRTISSDWLILGVGPMYRGIKQPQTLSLFDENNEIQRESDRYSDKNVVKSVSENLVKEEKVDKVLHETTILEQNALTTSKLVKKIIVYYDDNTFQEFVTNS